MKKENREKIVSVRFTQTEMKKIQAEAEQYNIAISTLIREKIFKGEKHYE